MGKTYTHLMAFSVKALLIVVCLSVVERIRCKNNKNYCGSHLRFQNGGQLPMFHTLYYNERKQAQEGILLGMFSFIRRAVILI
jgi:hypothetical protein